MVQIVATPEQLKTFAEANGSVEIVDLNGNRVGFFAKPFSSEEVRLAKESIASSEPRYSTEQVLQHLRDLEQTE